MEFQNDSQLPTHLIIFSVLEEVREYEKSYNLVFYFTSGLANTQINRQYHFF